MTTLAIDGVYRLRQFRKDMLVVEHIFNNSLTVRGALELLGRLVATFPIPEAYGSQIDDTVNILSPTLEVILEENFVALDRDDRWQYYNGTVPSPSYGDNRQWDALFFGNVPIEWDDLPTLSESPDGSMQATFTYSVEPAASTWRGLWISHLRQSGSPRIRAVLASAVLDDPIQILNGDTVEISWTLILTPTFV